MRSFTANVCDKASEDTLLELQHVGGRQIMRYQHQWDVQGVAQLQLLLGPCMRPGSHSLRVAAFLKMQHTFCDLLEVCLALAQIGIFHVVKLATNHFHLTAERPLGVVKPRFDPMLHTQ